MGVSSSGIIFIPGFVEICQVLQKLKQDHRCLQLSDLTSHLFLPFFMTESKLKIQFLPHSKHPDFITQPGQLTLLRKVIVVQSEHCTNTQLQSVSKMQRFFSQVKAVGTCSNLCVSNSEMGSKRCILFCSCVYFSVITPNMFVFVVKSLFVHKERFLR